MCTAKGISDVCTHVPSFLLDSLPIHAITEYWVEFPVKISYPCLFNFRLCLGFASSPRVSLVAVGEREVLFAAMTSLVEHDLSGSRVSVVVAPRLVATWHVGSSWAGDRTAVPCFARWILYHWTIREALVILNNYCYLRSC